MEGPQNTELTRKKGAYALPTITPGFQKTSRRTHWYPPTTAYASAVPTRAAHSQVSQRPRHGSRANPTDRSPKGRMNAPRKIAPLRRSIVQASVSPVQRMNAASGQPTDGGRRDEKRTKAESGYRPRDAR